MKVWITKYALTKGIIEIDAEIVDGKYAHTTKPLRLFTTEWASTKTEAFKIAEGMRRRRVMSLHKSIEKLEALTVRIAEVTP